MSIQNPKIWLSSPHMGDEELENVKDAFENNWVAPAGPAIHQFEKDLAKYFNVHDAAALASGTGALHLALVNLGVKRGDEVICQSMTFAASANPITYLGAKPIFIDSESNTWNIDPEVVRQVVVDKIAKGKKPKAIIVVHLYGMPAKMTELENISMEFDIPIIEDAAEAAGSTYLGKKCGSFGRMGIMSFNGNKIITTSGGGALLSNDWHTISQARFLATQAKDNAPHYQHSQIGYNYRISNICAAIGVGQMKVLDKRVQQRRANFDFYYEKLNDLPGLSFLMEPDGHFSNRWLTAIVVEPKLSNGVTRERIRLTLDADNIESRPLWKPLHMQPVYKYAEYYGNGVAENLFQHGLCLPSGSNLTQSDLNRVVGIIREVFNGSHEDDKGVTMSKIA
ncbi:DegT/DnrJ/EryC1/StrS family aminotransferase [bacterium SCSIO 12643]|nr:DegT/DnrJ/EryC1/StrS family aminotransferase [bacterium SCSIO 12643]